MLFLMLCPLMASGQNYIAFFSAETENYRRIVLDGVGNRSVRVKKDDLGGVLISIWGARQEDYVGRRHYEEGYLVPVIVQIDFPRRNLMTLQVSGNRFVDVVRYKLVDPDLYVIDLYTRELPQESIFREQTIAALWPNGRFQPDIGSSLPPPVPIPAPVAGAQRLGLGRALVWELGPYVGLFKRAILWAGGALVGLLGLSLSLVIWWRRRHVETTLPETEMDAEPVESGILAEEANLSYDEAALLAELKNDRARATA